MASTNMNGEAVDAEGVSPPDDPSKTQVVSEESNATVVVGLAGLAGEATTIALLSEHAKLTLAPGQVLGRIYEIQGLIAEGGMAAVYRAKNLVIGTEHAIKVMLPELADDPRIENLFKDEARKLSLLRHDATVAYQGIGQEENGLLYLVMEFVEGPSLAKLVGIRGKLSVAEVRELRDRCAEGLAAAHDAKIVHRDLSPENIVLVDGMASKAKIIDFGIAKSLRDGDGTVLEGHFAGRYSYASPEQLGVIKERVDERSDIYSLGLVLAGAAAGKPLPMGKAPHEIMASRMSVPDLQSVPAELRGEISAMLHPNPAQRPKSMRLLPKSGTAAGTGIKGPPLGRAVAAVIALVLVAAAGGGYLVVQGQHPTKSDAQPQPEPAPPSKLDPTPPAPLPPDPVRPADTAPAEPAIVQAAPVPTPEPIKPPVKPTAAEIEAQVAAFLATHCAQLDSWTNNRGDVETAGYVSSQAELAELKRIGADNGFDGLLTDGVKILPAPLCRIPLLVDQSGTRDLNIEVTVDPPAESYQSKDKIKLSAYIPHDSDVGSIHGLVLLFDVFDSGGKVTHLHDAVAATAKVGKMVVVPGNPTPPFGANILLATVGPASALGDLAKSPTDNAVDYLNSLTDRMARPGAAISTNFTIFDTRP